MKPSATGATRCAWPGRIERWRSREPHAVSAPRGRPLGRARPEAGVQLGQQRAEVGVLLGAVHGQRVRQPRRKRAGAHEAVVEQPLAGRAQRRRRDAPPRRSRICCEAPRRRLRAGTRGTWACGARAGDRRRRIRTRSSRPRDDRARPSRCPSRSACETRCVRARRRCRRPRRGDAPLPSGPSRRRVAGSSTEFSRCAAGCQTR